MKIKKNANGAVIATAVAMLFSACAAKPITIEKNSTGHSVRCVAANQCKGQSQCAIAENACKGLNNCKGEGFIVASSLRQCLLDGGILRMQ